MLSVKTPEQTRTIGRRSWMSDSGDGDVCQVWEDVFPVKERTAGVRPKVGMLPVFMETGRWRLRKSAAGLVICIQAVGCWPAAGVLAGGWKLAGVFAGQRQGMLGPAGGWRRRTVASKGSWAVVGRFREPVQYLGKKAVQRNQSWSGLVQKQPVQVNRLHQDSCRISFDGLRLILGPFQVRFAIRLRR